MSTVQYEKRDQESGGILSPDSQGGLTDYQQFLKGKAIAVPPTGCEPSSPLNPMLFDYQRDIVKWALARGKAAVWADCGMGKGPMQLEWCKQQPYEALIVAPLAVAHQFIRESEKFGIELSYAKDQSEVKTRITVTNYQRLEKFDADKFGAISLDESSILKSLDGQTRKYITEEFRNTPFRLASSATPAPNNFMEIGSHSEFLGVLTRTEMLSTFFVHDGGDTSKWRLKGHAEEEYWKWICQWAVMLRQPSDLGYENNGFVLPPLRYHHHVVKSNKNLDGYLFPVEAQTLLERRGARRGSLNERVEMCAALVNESTEPWLVWCDLNAEGDALAKMIPDAVQVAGRDKDEDKEERLLGFAEGRYRVMVSKPSIAGHGLNLQRCSNVAFVGLSDSWEMWYQAIRRCWRFGQLNPVDCHVITSEAEGAVVKNIQRKEADAAKMAKEMVKHMSVYNTEAVRGTVRTADLYKTKIEKDEDWELRLGDCVEQIADVKDDSVHYSIFSPPFASLYTYSASERDMGNARTHSEFYKHFMFLIAELYRVIMPGRLVSFHCTNIAMMKERDGVIGIHDFRGDLIRLFVEAGFIYHSEVVIWKDPVTAMQRTKALGLLHKQLVKDSCMSRQGIPDYLVTMRKPGENPERVAGLLDTYIGDDPVMNDQWNPEFPRPSDAVRNSINIWQRYASPIWMDIDPGKTLQKESAREQADERHICPLQLQVIERAIDLWTNPNDLILSPFAGIGSEGYVALQHGRRFFGIELKSSYFDQAVANLKNAQVGMQEGLFAMAAQ